jgi:hypothetical protein
MAVRHFRALARVKTPDEGGRSIGIFLKNYRPDLAFDGERLWWGAQLRPDPAEGDGEGIKIDLGETKEVDFELRTPGQILPRLRVGQVFKMMEGRTPIADCVITMIY